jgi:glycosyltransferase involved in cell wall biosynthesis
VIGRDALPDLYASSDAFVMPSTTETQGLVLAEALAAGVLVVAADAPQNRDVLGGAGILVAPDAQAFAQALSGVPAVRETAMAEAARAAAQRFAGSRQIDRMLALYESLVRPAQIA